VTFKVINDVTNQQNVPWPPLLLMIAHCGVRGCEIGFRRFRTSNIIW
jgi:hypothetical protein